MSIFQQEQLLVGPESWQLLEAVRVQELAVSDVC